MSTVVDYDVAMEIASHEAVIRQAYKDSVGKWTWSVGLTSATGHVVERYIGKPQSLEHCLRVYVWALDNYADEVRRVFKGFALTKAQFAAALSFHWNTGKIGSASWVEKFKAGQMKAAEKAFMLYRNPPEVVGRRKAEADLLFRGVWSNKGSMTEYTKLTPKGTPMWSSAKRINVEKELRAALAGEIPASDKVIVEKPVKVEVPVEVEVEKPTVPKKIDEKVKQQSGFWEWLTGLFGSGTLGLGWFAGLDRDAMIAGGVILMLVVALLVWQRHRVISIVREIREELEA